MAKIVCKQSRPKGSMRVLKPGKDNKPAAKSVSGRRRVKHI